MTSPYARPPAARQQTPPPVETGDLMPRLSVTAADGRRFDSQGDSVAGKPMILFLAATPDEVRSAFPDGWRRGFPAGTAAAVCESDAERLTDLPNVVVLPDPAGTLRRGLGHADGPAAILVGPNMHCAGVWKGAAPDALVAAAVAEAARRDGARVRGAGAMHPPVLLVPDVMSRADCQRLITIFRTDGNVWVEPGHMVAAPPHDYKMRIPENRRKDRIDHWVVNAGTNAFIDDRLRRRLFPEIHRAFHYRITRREVFRIACYEGERGGKLHGHRDNVEPQVAHRRFAVTINLNAEDFEGGGIRFPEYADLDYKPATGDAIVFSSSVLHEPMHVTQGRRYALLGFLFGES